MQIGFSAEELQEISKNGIYHAFLDENRKRENERSIAKKRKSVLDAIEDIQEKEQLQAELRAARKQLRDSQPRVRELELLVGKGGVERNVHPSDGNSSHSTVTTYISRLSSQY